MISRIEGLLPNKKSIRYIIISFAFFNILFVSILLLKYNDGISRVSSIGHGQILNFIGSGSSYGNKQNVSQSSNTIDTDSNLDLSSMYGPLPYYDIPNDNDGELSASYKILQKLNDITKDKSKYFLAHTELTDYQIDIDPRDFSRAANENKTEIFYDPRLTFAVYLNEIKRQYLAKNPENEHDKVDNIVVPFAWQDWVDLTVLNEHIIKNANETTANHISCEELTKSYTEGTKIKDFCIDYKDMTESDLKEMGLRSKDFTPGFAIKKSPETISTNEVRILEAKGHLLTYAKIPLNLMFLTKNGVYEARVAEEKQKMVDSDIVENFINDKKWVGGSTKLKVNPVDEYIDLLKSVPPDTTSAEDALGYINKMKDANDTVNRELHVPVEAYNYQKDKIESQIVEYNDRKKQLKNAIIDNDKDLIKKLEFSRSEEMYYQSLIYSTKFSNTNEPTYYKLARLRTDVPENTKDAGWHYEWRFFNGALRYVKKGWSTDELLTREKIILDRILRNWFRFASERGILSWIAHGPLLAWYWDGLLFPFDEDIDIQLPAQEIIRFSKLYNQTLVLEDPSEGFGKFFIDCSTFVHHRDRSHNQNHIDARFIDIDSGSYIDITGLGISSEKLPEKYSKLEVEAKKKNEPRPVYNCRNVHFYSQQELSPFRLTSMAGVPLYVPNQIKPILKDEYSRGMTWYEYYNFYYVNTLNLWLHIDKFVHVLPANINTKDNQAVIDELAKLTDEQTLSILEKHQDVLIEYYLTHETTELHREEMALLFDVPNGASSNISQVGAMKDEKEISNSLQYNKLTSKLKNFRRPVSRPLYNFEYIDRIKAKGTEEDL